MTKIQEQKHKQKFELYRQGLNDCQIAEAVFTSRQNIYDWRKKNKLPLIAQGVQTNVSMEKALTPKQCGEMKRFFNTLLNFADKYPSKKIDVTVFIREYRVINTGRVKGGLG
jgi:hypothetical protein